MNQESVYKFSKEERKLFKSIADHIQAKPNYYKQAGRWLDEYCSESTYWSRRKEKLDKLIKQHDKFPILTYQREMAHLESEIKDKRALATAIRLNDAQNYFSDRYKDQEFIPTDEAKKVILITWLLTDPDAENIKLNITEFEKWKWEPINDVSKLSRGYKGFLFAHNKAPWMGLVKIAWGKIDATTQDIASQIKKGHERFWQTNTFKFVVIPVIATLFLGLPSWFLFFRENQNLDQQTMIDSPGGVQVIGDLHINQAENPLNKPIVTAKAFVEVRIKSDLDFNGLVANMKAYLAFGKEDKALLKTSTIGYIASQTGKGEVIYKANLNMDASDSAVGNPVSFLRDTEYIQIVFGRMPADSNVLGGSVVCTINNSVRLESTIPPQTLSNGKIFIRDTSEFLQALNEHH